MDKARRCPSRSRVKPGTSATVPPGAGKRQVTLRLDAEVLERFKAGGRGWQTRINAVLRAYVAARREG